MNDYDHVYDHAHVGVHKYYLYELHGCVHEIHFHHDYEDEYVHAHAHVYVHGCVHVYARIHYAHVCVHEYARVGVHVHDDVHVRDYP
uniref:Uncharacterized protein n=1 Tax=Clostridium carboxidivorans P7 TaxID=536227 RepID=E2IQB7_9CLOT|nr:hypothetical protein Ccar_3241 [Clostridium carboxidivorans P7]